MTTKAQAKKSKLDFIKMKNICDSNNTIKKMKGQPSEWEKISAYHVSDKGLVFRTYKQLLQTTIKRQPN